MLLLMNRMDESADFDVILDGHVFDPFDFRREQGEISNNSGGDSWNRTGDGIDETWFNSDVPDQENPDLLNADDEDILDRIWDRIHQGIEGLNVINTEKSPK